MTNTKIDLDLTSAVGKTIFTTGGYFKKGTYTLTNYGENYISFNRIAIAGTTCTQAWSHLRNSYTWTQNVDGYTYFGLEGDGGATDYTDTPVSVELVLMINEGSSALPYEPYGDTIDEEYLKDVNVTFGERFGPVNSVVLTRSGGSDSIYRSDDTSISQNGLTEVKIEDNQIMNNNDRDSFIDGIWNRLNGLQYYVNDYTSIGICYYDLLDRYNVKVGNTYYSCLMLNDEIDVTQGLVEEIHAESIEQSETDYTKADKTDRRIKQAYIIVDKQNQQINAVVQNVNTLSDMVNSQGEQVDALGTQLTQSLSQVQVNVTAIQNVLTNGVNLVKTTSVTIDDSGLSVSTDTSKISTIMTNNAFEIRTKGMTNALAFFGYDEVEGTSKARMDNLTVTNYFITGYHRFEKSTSTPKKTLIFYIGG